MLKACFENVNLALKRDLIVPSVIIRLVLGLQSFYSAIWGKGPRPKYEKKIILTSKLGEINDIEHNKGSKIYPQNQVILDCIMSSIPLKHKCSSIILIWVIVSLFFYCSQLGKSDMVLGKKVAIFD